MKTKWNRIDAVYSWLCRDDHTRIGRGNTYRFTDGFYSITPENYSLSVDFTGFASGTYLIKLTQGEQIDVQKISLVK